MPDSGMCLGKVLGDPLLDTSKAMKPGSVHLPHRPAGGQMEEPFSVYIFLKVSGTLFCSLIAFSGSFSS